MFMSPNNNTNQLTSKLWTKFDNNNRITANVKVEQEGTAGGAESRSNVEVSRGAAAAAVEWLHVSAGSPARYGNRGQWQW